MMSERIKQLQIQISKPVLIKKKENLFYLTGKFFMHGYLLIKPMRADKNGLTRCNIFGDGLEKVDGLKTDRLKTLRYTWVKRMLELEDELLLPNTIIELRAQR
jgi:hypothetical protein